MPIFEYSCEVCGKVFEEIVNGNRDKKISCPSCQSTNTKKLMSAIGSISMGRSSDSPCGSSCSSASSCSASGGGCCPHAG